MQGPHQRQPGRATLHESAGAAGKEQAYAEPCGSVQVELQPNNAAPLLRDERARREWLERELDMSSQVGLAVFSAPKPA